MATDVLSFPAPEGNGLAGDIAISLDIARRNARERNEALEEEVRVLILHGLLHLVGYDHEIDNGAMERREQQLRKSFALASGLIERTRDPKGGKNSRQSAPSRRKNRASPPRTRSRAGQP